MSWLLGALASSALVQATRKMSAAAAAASYNALQPYEAPHWARDLACRPPSFVKLAMRPTPIHPWDLPGVPEGFQVSVKRDDMTGSTLSGNKVRKLEFLLADALQQGCDSVLTCGSIQSNHARTTAMAARQLGLTPHLMLRCHGEIDVSAVGCRGNSLLNRLSGAKIVLIPPLSYEGRIVGGKKTKGLRDKMEEYAEILRSEGHKPYLIPVGGSNEVGVWGYIEAFREMMEQGVLEEFDDVVLATGSGGSICGLAVANHLTGSKTKLHAVCVCDNEDYFYQHIDEQLETLGLTRNVEGKPLRARDLVDIIDGYKGLGYGRSTDEELAQLVEVVGRTGVSLDPVYTLKGVRGLLSELGKNPQRFAGRRVLYIHTGGVFGVYDGTVDGLLIQTPAASQIYSHSDILPG